ncbi:ATP-binding protein [Micromonospora thermarum]|uniref:ATP-binding protein n=1 Tax=Micromonospora thermarum TaxID=2720024 RepID=A0ABX0Z2C1_9ACTN|nr:ATP-binding protein [Micromonospora thermarum]NJP31937.1 ATP-binding protein [Micromonospora thermarum]
MEVLIGRRAELDLFRSALTAGAGARTIHFVHGPGGIGKSALLRGFAEVARQAQRPVLEIDGRTAPCTPAAFSVVAGVGDPSTVLLLDSFERCHRLEDWFWENFLPRLPARTVLAVASRTPPDPRWSLDPGWSRLLNVITLGELEPESAVEVLRAHGSPDSRAAGTGNPFLLTTAGEADEDTLLRHLTGDVPSGRHRAALEVCAHARATSEPLLRAALGTDGAEVFSWLRAQPYIKAGPGGLVPHEAVRHAVRTGLRRRNPDGFAELHHLIRRHLLARIRTAPATEVPHATGDLLYLYRGDQGTARCGEEFEAELRLIEEMPYQPDYRGDILRLVRMAEGAESASIAGYWLARQPHSFRVHRLRRTGAVVGFSAWLRLEQLGDSGHPDGADVDPVVAAAWRHARMTGPLSLGEHLGIARFSVTESGHRHAAASMTLARWRSVGEMLRARRAPLSYAVVPDRGQDEAPFDDLNLLRLDERPYLGAHGFALFGCDWRVQSAEQWLEVRSKAMLAGAPVPQAPQAPRPGCRDLVVLSRTEFDVAVRDALGRIRHRASLTDNPLQRSRLIRVDGADLTELLTLTAESLREQRGGEARYRALATTYFRRAPTQAAAAARLNLPFGTYRRHLASAVRAVSDCLWRQETQGSGVTHEA